MAYEKTVWKNREVERPRTFEKIENPDGTITLVPAEGNIIEPGTPIIAENMNNIEQGIVLSLSQIGDINNDTLPDDLRGKPLTEQIMYVLQHAGKVKSVNGKTGEVMIDVSDIAGLNYTRLTLGQSSRALGNAIAIGINAFGSQNGSVALGNDVKANGIAIGEQAYANGGTAFGDRASSDGGNSCAIGIASEALNSYEGVLGVVTGAYGPYKWKVPGSLDVSGTKNFEIPHPKPEKKATHVIRHGAVESPTPGDTLYRWKIQATKDNDLVTIDLPDYFIYLNKDIQIFVTPQGHFGAAYGELDEEKEQLRMHCQHPGEYNVLVIGTRNDDHQSVQDWNIKGVEREIGESWTGETYAFSIDEIIEIEEIKEEVM